MLREWPLVAFTILGQTAVGMLLIFAFPWLLLGTYDSTFGAKAKILVFLGLIVGLLGLGALLSFFHLHHPLRARRFLANVRTSWLSREILFELALMGLVGLGALLIWAEAKQLWLLKTVIAAACISGLGFLLSMVKLYRLPTIPAWDLLFTPFSFLTTTLNLGMMATALICRILGIQNDVIGELLRVALVLTSCEIGLILALYPHSGIGNGPPAASLRPPAIVPKSMHLGRIVLLVSVLFLLGAILVRRIPDMMAPFDLGSFLLQVGAMIVLSAAEILGRFLFYGLVPRPGD